MKIFNEVKGEYILTWIEGVKQGLKQLGFRNHISLEQVMEINLGPCNRPDPKGLNL